MIRQLVRAAMILTATVFLLDAAWGQPPAADRIYVRDKDKKDGSIKAYDGTIKAAPVGYQIVSAEGKAPVIVAPADIVKVLPGDVPGVDRPSLQSLWTIEEKKTRKDNEAARQGYIDLIQKAGASAPAKTKQYLAFKKALLGSRILDESEAEEWAKQADPMVKEWEDYLAEYKTGWEAWYAARAAARLYVELNKYGDAERLWKRLSAAEYELPPDLKAEAVLQMIDAQIRGGGYASAATAAETAAKNPALSTSAKEKLAIYARAAKAGDSVNNAETLAAAVKDIEARMAAVKDNPSVTAVGCSMIGELYLAAKRPDAKWNFLYVETVYNGDKDEVLKAMVRLSQIFKSLMDDDRAKLYREKIRRLSAQL